MTEERLTPAELVALIEAGMLRSPRIEPEVRAALILKGFIEERLGGLGRTRLGEQYLRKHGTH